MLKLLILADLDHPPHTNPPIMPMPTCPSCPPIHHTQHSWVGWVHILTTPHEPSNWPPHHHPPHEHSNHPTTTHPMNPLSSSHPTTPHKHPTQEPSHHPPMEKKWGLNAWQSLLQPLCPPTCSSWALITFRILTCHVQIFSNPGRFQNLATHHPNHNPAPHHYYPCHHPSSLHHPQHASPAHHAPQIPPTPPPPPPTHPFLATPPSTHPLMEKRWGLYALYFMGST